MDIEIISIEGVLLTKEAIGSKVTHIPNHAAGNASHPDCEGGTISSWNHYFVFVDYGKGTNAATRPQDLVWG